MAYGRSKRSMPRDFMLKDRRSKWKPGCTGAFIATSLRKDGSCGRHRKDTIVRSRWCFSRLQRLMAVSAAGRTRAAAAALRGLDGFARGRLPPALPPGEACVIRRRPGGEGSNRCSQRLVLSRKLEAQVEK